MFCKLILCCFFERQKGREGRDGDIQLSSAGSLCEHQKWLGLGSVEAEGMELNPDLPHGWKDHDLH